MFTLQTHNTPPQGCVFLWLSGSNTPKVSPAMFRLALSPLVVLFPSECIILTVHIGLQVADTHLLR